MFLLAEPVGPDAAMLVEAEIIAGIVVEERDPRGMPAAGVGIGVEDALGGGDALAGEQDPVPFEVADEPGPLAVPPAQKGAKLFGHRGLKSELEVLQFAGTG